MIEENKTIIKNSDAVLISAGAGMGVDSGLPDFRGDEGFSVALGGLEGIRKILEKPLDEYENGIEKILLDTII